MSSTGPSNKSPGSKKRKRTPDPVSSSPPAHAALSSFQKLIERVNSGHYGALKEGSNSFAYRKLLKVTDKDLRLPDLIRVLVLHPPKNDEDDVEVSLELQTLPVRDNNGNDISAPTAKQDPVIDKSYMALSYAWNDQKETESIKLRRDGSGQDPYVYRVTPNLRDALQALRRGKTSPIRLWADAVCIDQNNKKEKSQQLPLMPRIYSEATKVCVWLGREIRDHENEEDVTTQAFDLIRAVHNKGAYFNNLTKKHTTCDQWLAFVQLINVSWFSRRWIVQEIVLASQAEVRCGTEKVSWTEFAQAVAYFDELEDRVRKMFRSSKKNRHNPDMFGHVSQLSASRLVKVTSEVVRRRDDGRVAIKTENLEMLISNLTQFHTGEPKDVVYAILSLAKDVKATAADVSLDRIVHEKKVRKLLKKKGITEKDKQDDKIQLLQRISRRITFDRFPVNYTKDFSEVCDDLFKFVTTASNSLNMICRPWCPHVEGLATWIRPQHDQPFIFKDGRMIRINADSLVGLPGQSPYSAAGRNQGRWEFSRDCTDLSILGGRQLLSVEGFQLDELGLVEDAAGPGFIPRGWLKHRTSGPTAGSQNRASSTKSATGRVSDTFWQTMIAEKSETLGNPPFIYSMMAGQLFNDSIHLDTGAALLQAQAKGNRMMEKFIQRIIAVVFGRKLTKTTVHERLALVPSAAQKGDKIVILYGCSVPVVLRQDPGTNLWSILGECYMYGMMHGEALNVRRASLTATLKGPSWSKSASANQTQVSALNSDSEVFRIR